MLSVMNGLSGKGLRGRGRALQPTFITAAYKSTDIKIISTEFGAEIPKKVTKKFLRDLVSTLKSPLSTLRKLSDFLKVICTVLAYGADIISGKLLALVNITADFTAVALLFGLRLGLGLDVFLVVCVGKGLGI